MNKPYKPRIENIASQCINQTNKTKKTNTVLSKPTWLESYYYIRKIKHILKMLRKRTSNHRIKNHYSKRDKHDPIF
jgi:acyl carrier protein phosphodiesterase